ncbi:hypothetical protein [Burkholderia ubonensis]|uniref:hypothetical protein n=1 Tax=Burkholderia ubonensis TaxID=101571 RepID=UPI00075BD265|nr:hypothetical protein [Burkholderia ubonensis]KWN65863.1 hypothetical protein WM23_07700 [Burkholderia ubonensis]
MNGTAVMTGHVWVLLACAVGALVPVVLVEGLAPRQRVIYVLVGMVTATFISPGIVEYFLPQAGDALRGAVAFAVGLVGMKLAEIVIRLVNRRGENFAQRWADAMLGEEHKPGDHG